MSLLIRVIDFETTGLPTDEGGASLVETGFCDVRVDDGMAAVIGLPVSAYVNPGRPIPVIARAVHHIGDDDVAHAAVQEVALAAITPEAANQVIYAAHNADFERAFFGADARWICTYKVALRLWPDAPAHSNQVLRYHLSLAVDAGLAQPVHRAGPDAYVTAFLLAHCINDGRASVDEMVRWSDGPALLPRIPFGKHRGSRWEDVPVDYLDWVANKSDLDRDAKANARHHLKKRGAA